MEVNTVIKYKTERLGTGQHKLACPVCQKERTKHKGDKPLSVSVQTDKTIYNCHHCGEKGIISKKTNGYKKGQI